MSIEEYFNSEMYKAKDALNEIIQANEIDWDRFDLVLASLPDINTICDDDTILSELYHECPDGSILVEITKHFLANGYDVNANKGMNGSQCLHNLCWATFDKYILDAAKLLLEAGARTDLPLDKDERNEDTAHGVKSSISWRLGGDWVQGDYTIANIFEAYWEIVEAFEAGKDYRPICAFDECIGEALTRAELIPSDENKSIVNYGPLSLFDGQIVFWFGSKPLVISKYIEFVINPLAVDESKDKTISVDEYFRPLLNAHLNEFVFIDQCTAQLLFDNGMYLLLSNTDYRDRDNRLGFFEIRKAGDTINIIDKLIDRIGLLPGRTYSDSCDQFGEHSAALICGKEAFLVHVYPEEYSKSHEIRFIECSQEFVSEYKRCIDLPELKPDKAFSHNDKLAGLRMLCDTKYFYIFVTDYHELQLKLGSEKCTSYDELNRNHRSEKLVFHEEVP